MSNIYRRVEMWGISIDDEIGKQRILKDIEEAHDLVLTKEIDDQ